jgi:hypothetical protein
MDGPMNDLVMCHTGAGDAMHVELVARVVTGERDGMRLACNQLRQMDTTKGRGTAIAWGEKGDLNIVIEDATGRVSLTLMLTLDRESLYDSFPEINLIEYTVKARETPAGTFYSQTPPDRKEGGGNGR